MTWRWGTFNVRCGASTAQRCNARTGDFRCNYGVGVWVVEGKTPLQYLTQMVCRGAHLLGIDCRVQQDVAVFHVDCNLQLHQLPIPLFQLCTGLARKLNLLPHSG